MGHKATKIVCEIITSHEFNDAGVADIEWELRNRYGGNLNIDSVSVSAETIEVASVCPYCGENCPDDPDHACDGYLGDIDGLCDD